MVDVPDDAVTTLFASCETLSRFLPLEDAEDSQVSNPPSTPLSVLSLGERWVGEDVG